MQSHLRILAFLYIAYHALGLVVGLIIFGLLSGVGLLSGDVQAAGILTIVGVAIAGLIMVLSIPGIIGGIGLLARWRWARILVLVIGAFSLLEFPIGTAVGVYTFWVLLHQDTRRLFMQGY